MKVLSRAGFVLVGGNSTRMGRDKALLAFRGSTFLARIADCVHSVSGSVTLVGEPARYEGLLYNALADGVPGCGPLGGIYTALSTTNAQWNLIVACDMPLITVDLLEGLFADAESGPSHINCVISEHAGRLDPLCAVYRRDCAAAACSAIDQKLFKVLDFVSTLRVRAHSVSTSGPLTNVNTPAEWNAL